MSQTAPKVRACLFDMDGISSTGNFLMIGLLIDSERIYTEVTNTFLASHGKGPLPAEIKAQLMGRSGTQSSQVLIEWAQLDLTSEQVFEQMTGLQQTMWSTTKPLPGAEQLIQNLVANKIPIALATSSHRLNYHRKTTHLQQDFFCHFPGDRVIVGDDSRIPQGRGKPHGDIYLLALSTINKSLPEGVKPILPAECLVFEDAVLGVESARNAGMQVVWVPDPLIKDAFRGQETEILGNWGKEVESLAHVDLRDYGIGL